MIIKLKIKGSKAKAIILIFNKVLIIVIFNYKKNMTITDHHRIKKNLILFPDFLLKLNCLILINKLNLN
jgi:hypothetical protein